MTFFVFLEQKVEQKVDKRKKDSAFYIDINNINEVLFKAYKQVCLIRSNQNTDVDDLCRYLNTVFVYTPSSPVPLIGIKSFSLSVCMLHICCTTQTANG